MEDIFQRHSDHLFFGQDVTMVNTCRVLPILKQHDQFRITYLARVDGMGLLPTMTSMEQHLPNPGDAAWFEDIDGRWVIVFRSMDGHLNYFSQLNPGSSGLVSSLIVRDGRDVVARYPMDDAIDLFDLVDALSQMTSAKSLATALLADLKSILGEVIVNRQLQDLNQALSKKSEVKEFHPHNTVVSSQTGSDQPDPETLIQAFEAGLICDVVALKHDALSLIPPNQREENMNQSNEQPTRHTRANAAPHHAHSEEVVATVVEAVETAPASYSGWKKTGLFVSGVAVGAAAAYGIQRYYLTDSAE